MKSFSNQENFYKRLRELSNVDAPTKSVALDKQSLIEYSRANDGSALGIVKEEHNYFIKSSNSKGDLAVEHFTYIGGLENKLKYKYNSLGEASKQMNVYIGVLNESLEKKFNPAKTLNEEKELVAKSNADKGAVASAQDKADANSKGETLKPSASEKKVGEPVSKEGIANAQSEADKKKSDDASEKLKKQHEPSTASGAARGDIAKAQGNADATSKGETLKDSAKQKEVGEPVAKTSGAAKAQSAADANKSDDSSAKNKISGHKEVKPASDAKKEKAIVAENFGEEETEIAPEEPGAGPSANAAGAAEGIPTPDAGGDETEDLAKADAAADALDNLNIDASAAGEDMGAASAEVPSGDSASPEAGSTPDASPEAGAADQGAAGGDDAALKDVEKLVGKTGQKIRSTELSDEMVGGFLKSLISSFEGKLGDLDSDLRREIANKILKAGEEGEESNGSPESVTPDSATSPSAEQGAENGGGAEEVDENSVAIPADHEIEEAINQHLAEMGMADEGGVGAVGGAPAQDAEPAMGASQHPNSFKKYMGERGYDGAANESISIMEMVSLVNGYANECGDNYDNADMQTIAEYMSPEVKKGVTECGYGKFAEGVQVFNIKPKTYKSAEPIVEIHEEFEEDKVDEKKVDEKKEFPFAPAGASLNKAEKEKEAEKKEDKKEEVSESAKSKLRSIINMKIQEQLGLKKKTINENAKSAFSKKLDEMIAAEINKGKETLKVTRKK